MQYTLTEVVVDTVINVEGSPTQGLVLVQVSKQAAIQKQDLAKRIDQEMHALQRKYQHYFWDGRIHLNGGNNRHRWMEYLRDYTALVLPLLEKFHALTPSGKMKRYFIHSNPKRRYRRGDFYYES